MDVMGRLKKFTLELWSYKYVYKWFYRTKIQMLVKFNKSLKLQFRSYMTVCKNNETFKKIGYLIKTFQDIHLKKDNLKFLGSYVINNINSHNTYFNVHMLLQGRSKCGDLYL